MFDQATSDLAQASRKLQAPSHKLATIGEYKKL